MISTPEQFLQPLYIPNEDLVYRQAHITRLSKFPNDKKKRFPDESHFKPDPDGLSVNWNGQCTVKGIYEVIGISFKHETSIYKNYREFRLFGLPVGFVRSVEGINDVVHSPVFNGNPAAIGSPNNYAHASILYPDDEEIRVKLSDFCRENYDQIYCTIDFDLLDPIINELRERLDNTPYHRLAEPDLKSGTNKS